MKTLSMEQYRSNELDATRGLPNRAIECFQPCVFQQVGYPTKLFSDDSIWKYIDSMQECRAETDYRSFVEGFTEEEFETFEYVLSKYAEFSQKLCGKIVVPFSTFVRAVNGYRHLKTWVKHYQLKNPVIFEIGPGAGLLGILCIIEGWKHVSVEVTEAYYVLQNIVWNQFVDGKILEGALDPIDFSNLEKVIEGTQLVHIPWWEYARMDIDRVRPAFDLVTPNHVLAEMHPWALKYSLKFARQALRPQPSSGVLFEGWGCSRLNAHRAVSESLAAEGFQFLYNDFKITALSHASHRPASEETFDPKRLVKKVSLKTKLKGMIRPTPPEVFAMSPGLTYDDGKNTATSIIRKCRADDRAAKKVDYEKVLAVVKRLTRKENVLNEDEVFLKKSGFTYAPTWSRSP